MLSLPIHEHSLSIFLDLWFLTAVCYIFQHISPIHTVLGSYLSISLFLNKCAIIFLLLVSDVFTVSMQKDNSFWMLVLCPANLLNSLIFQELLRRILGIFYVDNHVICKQSFISSFPVWILFICFSSLISVARTSKTMLNNRASYLTSGHPCLVSDFRVNAFSFSPLRIMFALVCCKWPLLVVDSFCAHFLEEFILTYMGAECCKSFFCLY